MRVPMSFAGRPLLAANITTYSKAQ